jgi:acetyltransferase-like isoleucine patch superfamily enzyme
MIEDKGADNRIEVAATANVATRLVVHGDRNTVLIGARTVLRGQPLEIRGSDCEVRIGEGCILGGQIVLKASRARVVIGARTTSMSVLISMHEAGTITLGEDCMLSAQINMDVSDMHSILDLETGQRLNPARDITIGDHVWIGHGVYVSRGTTIGSGSVIGAKSLARGEIPANVVAAGVPARVIRTGIRWVRERV